MMIFLSFIIFLKASRDENRDGKLVKCTKKLSPDSLTPSSEDGNVNVVQENNTVKVGDYIFKKFTPSSLFAIDIPISSKNRDGELCLDFYNKLEIKQSHIPTTSKTVTRERTIPLDDFNTIGQNKKIENLSKKERINFPSRIRRSRHSIKEYNQTRGLTDDCLMRNTTASCEINTSSTNTIIGPWNTIEDLREDVNLSKNLDLSVLEFMRLVRKISNRLNYYSPQSNTFERTPNAVIKNKCTKIAEILAHTSKCIITRINTYCSFLIKSNMGEKADVKEVVFNLLWTLIKLKDQLSLEIDNAVLELELKIFHNVF